MDIYPILCSCGCGAQLGTVEATMEPYRGATGYGSYVTGHAIPGLSFMADGRYVPEE